jgi:hypothetical protein
MPAQRGLRRLQCYLWPGAIRTAAVGAEGIGLMGVAGVVVGTPGDGWTGVEEGVATVGGAGCAGVDGRTDAGVAGVKGSGWPMTTPFAGGVIAVPKPC